MRRLCLHKNVLQAHTTGKPLGLAKNVRTLAYGLQDATVLSKGSHHRGRRSKVQQKLHIRKFCVQLLGVTSPGRTLIETKINWGRRGSPAVKIQCNLKKCGSDYIEFNREPHHRAYLRVLESYSEFMLPYLPSHRGIGLPIALYVEHAIV